VKTRFKKKNENGDKERCLDVNIPTQFDHSI
jgi:hypothetical protein